MESWRPCMFLFVFCFVLLLVFDLFWGVLALVFWRSGVLLLFWAWGLLSAFGVLAFSCSASGYWSVFWRFGVFGILLSSGLGFLGIAFGVWSSGVLVCCGFLYSVLLLGVGLSFGVLAFWSFPFLLLWGCFLFPALLLGVGLSFGVPVFLNSGVLEFWSFASLLLGFGLIPAFGVLAFAPIW